MTPPVLNVLRSWWQCAPVNKPRCLPSFNWANDVAEFLFSVVFSKLYLLFTSVPFGRFGTLAVSEGSCMLRVVVGRVVGTGTDIFSSSASLFPVSMTVYPPTPLSHIPYSSTLCMHSEASVTHFFLPLKCPCRTIYVVIEWYFFSRSWRVAV